MSSYTTGNGGIPKIGDIVISLRDEIGYTGQKLLPCDGTSFDGSAYPELQQALGGTDLPSYGAAFDYKIVATSSNIQIVRPERSPIAVAVNGGGDAIIRELTNSEASGSAVGAPAAWAGDVLVSTQAFLPDGRNLVPCDGGAVDSRFGDLLDPAFSTDPALSITNSHANFTSTTSGGVINFQSTSSHAGWFSGFDVTATHNFFVEYELVSTPYDGNGSGEVGIRANTGTTYPPTSGNKGIGYTPHTSTYNYTGGTFQTAFSGLGAALAEGDLIAFGIDTEKDEVTVWVNGTLDQTATLSTLDFVDNNAYFVVSGAWSTPSEFNIRINSSRDGYSYNVVPAAKNLPNYATLPLPYKVVAQNPGTDGIPDYVHQPPQGLTSLEMMHSGAGTAPTFTEGTLHIANTNDSWAVSTEPLPKSGKYFIECEVISRNNYTTWGISDSVTGVPNGGNSLEYCKWFHNRVFGTLTLDVFDGSSGQLQNGELLTYVFDFEQDELTLYVRGVDKIAALTLSQFTNDINLFVGGYNGGAGTTRLRVNESRDGHTYGL